MRTQQVKKMLQDLDALTAGTAEFDALITKVMDHLKPHNDDEERDDLPQLEPVRIHLNSSLQTSLILPLARVDARRGRLQSRRTVLLQNQEGARTILPLAATFPCLRERAYSSCRRGHTLHCRTSRPTRRSLASSSLR